MESTPTVIKQFSDSIKISLFLSLEDFSDLKDRLTTSVILSVKIEPDDIRHQIDDFKKFITPKGWIIIIEYGAERCSMGPDDDFLALMFIQDFTHRFNISFLDHMK